MALVPSVLGAVIPSSFAQLAKPRAHHYAKLWNECLAKHQFSYIGFFFAVDFVATFDQSVSIWIKYYIGLAILLTFAFYFFGARSLAGQDAKIAMTHPNKQCLQDCNYSMRFRDVIRLLWAKLCGAVILFALAVYLVLLIR
jgi:hypothetical protein